MRYAMITWSLLMFSLFVIVFIRNSDQNICSIQVLKSKTLSCISNNNFFNFSFFYLYLKEKYTLFHLTVKMKDKRIITDMCEKEFLKCVIYNRNSDVYIWCLVASWAYEVTVILTQKGFFTASLCEDFSDLTSPTSNHIHFVHIYVKL